MRTQRLSLPDPGDLADLVFTSHFADEAGAVASLTVVTIRNAVEALDDFSWMQASEDQHRIFPTVEE